MNNQCSRYQQLNNETVQEDEESIFDEDQSRNSQPVNKGLILIDKETT